MTRFLFPLLIGLAGAAVLIGLGTWQVQRLAWKEGVLDQIESRISADPVALPKAPDPERDRYLSVVVEGTILPGELKVLVSRRNIGAGYRIIAPFVTEDGRRILIDRGFVLDDAKDTVRSLGPVEVSGNLLWPDEVDGFTPDPDTATDTWFARDLPAMANALDTEPVLVVASTPTDTGIEPMPVDTQGIPNDHLQYAITWFSLAAVWLAMTLLFLRRQSARQNEGRK